MVRLLVLMSLFWVTNAFASGSSSLNLAIPNASQSYQSDRIRSGNSECSMAIGSSTNVEFGVVGIMENNDGSTSTIGVDPYNQEGVVKDVGVYARIIIPIGAPKKRLDCNRLYELEIQRQRIEVMKLRQELQNLRQLKFEN